MGYKNSANSTCLLERGLIDGIMLKAQKGGEAHRATTRAE